MLACKCVTSYQTGDWRHSRWLHSVPADWGQSEANWGEKFTDCVFSFCRGSMNFCFHKKHLDSALSKGAMEWNVTSRPVACGRVGGKCMHSVYLQKSMAFWYNLKASGEGDYLTRHAGCPVLTGSKWGEWISDGGCRQWNLHSKTKHHFPHRARSNWRTMVFISVANKWIHERGQEFVRPCTLNPDE